MNTKDQTHLQTQKPFSQENPIKRRKRFSYRSVAIPVVVALATFAKGEAATTFESLWGLATLYKNDANSVIEEFKLRGRYHGQYHATDASQDDDDGWEDRRTRFGFDAKLFGKTVDARLDFQSNDGFHDFYDGLVDAYIAWKPLKTLAITAGKTKPLIGAYDWLESSNSQPTFERSQIFNQLNINRATGLTVSGSAGAFLWQTGVYSNATPSTTGGTGAFGDGEFGDFNGGVSYSVGAGYDFKDQLGVEKALLRFDWIHSDREPGDLVLGRYDDIVSGTFWVKQGPAAVVLEAFRASGGDGSNSDVFGFYLQPTYDIVPGQFQIVGRYSFATSDGSTGVRPQNRYESAAGGVSGDRYNAFYFGGQYFINGDKLKLLAGAEYSLLGKHDTDDSYDGLTGLVGIRFSF